jgi:hypothetical protein
MSSLDPRLRVLATPLLVALAIAGYLLGHRHAASAPPAREPSTRTLLTSSLLLTYPSDWAPAGAGPAIPGLSISGPAAIAPRGGAATAGLLTGQLLGGEASPLPAWFIARLRGLPDAQVVNLAETQAYRYSQLKVAGFERALTIYAIPGPSGGPTVIACYAAAAASPQMRTCERIAAEAQLQFAPQNDILTPDPDYARQVSAAVAAVAAHRTRLRHALSMLGVQPASQRVAARLASTLDAGAASLSTLPAPPAASQAQTLLSQAFARTGGAYAALAAAAGAGSRSRYVAARARVYAAESSIATALQGLALLGYERR